MTSENDPNVLDNDLEHDCLVVTMFSLSVPIIYNAKKGSDYATGKLSQKIHLHR